MRGATRAYLLLQFHNLVNILPLLIRIDGNSATVTDRKGRIFNHQRYNLVINKLGSVLHSIIRQCMQDFIQLNIEKEWLVVEKSKKLKKSRFYLASEST